ncbi:hypothetical protein A1D22_02725 [Pasteurellaceae bacterium LFhippo2]|nr:hypothetical protein [Pasteurellaceae bacterium LFhippo2]
MFFLKKCFVIFILIAIGLTYYFYPDKYPIYPESDHYSTETGKFANPFPDRPHDTKRALSALWELISNSEKFSPHNPLPMQAVDFKKLFAKSDKAKFAWFGHSSLIANLGSTNILIDPVFADSVSPIPIMMKRFQPAPIKVEDLPRIDLIIYSHNHYDHFDTEVLKHFISQKNAFIAPLGMEVLLKKSGISEDRIFTMDWWDSIHFGDFEITSVPARHNTGRSLFDKNKTLWSGYVFKTPAEQIYYSGDTSFGDGKHFEQIAKHFGQFDLALIENGQYNTAWLDNHLLPEQTAEVAKIVNAQRFMPVHWGAYPMAIHKWNEPLKLSIPLVEQYGIKVLTPILGEVFDKDTQTEKWWEHLE